MDIIIFSGQSNMQGQSESLSDTSAVKGAFEYKYLTNEILPLKNPVGENITHDRKKGVQIEKDTHLQNWHSLHIAGSACYGNTNLVPEFCRAYTEITQTETLAVHIAKGSTEIAAWLPETTGFEIIKEKASAAIKKAKEQNEIGKIYFVWLQGESDAISNRSKDYYKAKLAELCNALKAELNIDKFGIIRVGCFTNDERDLEIINAQNEICAENSNFLMLTTIASELNKMPQYMHPDILGHFSAKGLEKLGREAGKTLGKHK